MHAELCGKRIILHFALRSYVRSQGCVRCMHRFRSARFVITRNNFIINSLTVNPLSQTHPSFDPSTART